MESEKRFAILIDADNISAKYIRVILAELSNNGVATYKRIYGDWTTPNLNPWKAALLENSIIPIQQYAYTSGKNSTDSAMIIDAMDILYAANVDGFCIVSSDSDFTRLAARLREAGKEVIGMGSEKTPAPFRNACNKFRYLEVLEKANRPKEAPADSGKTKGGNPQLAEIKDAVDTILSDRSDEEGWTRLSDIGSALANRFPDFDVRNFGFRKLSDFVKSLGLPVKSVKVSEDSNTKAIYARQPEAKER